MTRQDVFKSLHDHIFSIKDDADDSGAGRALVPDDGFFTSLFEGIFQPDPAGSFAFGTTGEFDHVAATDASESEGIGLVAQGRDVFPCPGPAGRAFRKIDLSHIFSY